MHFFCLMAGGAVFVIMAFLMLPTLILMPAKFALCFTIGCCCVMAAFASLRGWRAQLAMMLERERLPFSAGYVASVLGTLYAALILHSYVLSLLTCGLQVSESWLVGWLSSVGCWLVERAGGLLADDAAAASARGSVHAHAPLNPPPPN